MRGMRVVSGRKACPTFRRPISEEAYQTGNENVEAETDDDFVGIEPCDRQRHQEGDAGAGKTGCQHREGPLP